jgi:hypothetical protein
MPDESLRRTYDQLWHNRERDRIARSKDVRAEARKALADKITEDAARRRAASAEPR